MFIKLKVNSTGTVFLKKRFARDILKYDPYPIVKFNVGVADKSDINRRTNKMFYFLLNITNQIEQPIVLQFDYQFELFLQLFKDSEIYLKLGKIKLNKKMYQKSLHFELLINDTANFKLDHNGNLFIAQKLLSSKLF